uniref:DDE Tnp4 domain-containing protein n=1 Tax=Laticauda laticaudata TaxID=8630 RepID=A0A8C5RNP6_LATLA
MHLLCIRYIARHLFRIRATCIHSDAWRKWKGRRTDAERMPSRCSMETKRLKRKKRSQRAPISDIKDVYRMPRGCLEDAKGHLHCLIKRGSNISGSHFQNNSLLQTSEASSASSSSTASSHVHQYLEELLQCPSTEEGWNKVEEQWYQKWNFPHTVGAIDGKHVACKAPAKSGSTYFNYKGFFSIILFAMVDADYKFMYIDASGNGSASDAQVYNASQPQGGSGTQPHRGLPRSRTLPNDTQDVFTSSWGMTPSLLTTYFMKLSGARQVVENAFGILANRFQVLLTTMQHRPETVRRIMEACCILHNLMRTRYPVFAEQARGPPTRQWGHGAWLMEAREKPDRH